jgi:hypothetical protein
VLDMQVSSPVLPPSQRRPDAPISAEADRLILKALDKTSSRRHLTLRLFLTELEAVKPAVAGQPASKGGDVGMAKTMLFAGNQADVARMVADAMAARNAAAAAGAAPAPAPVQPAAPAQAKPAASAQPANPISVMATLAVDSMAVAVQPPPAAAQPVAQAPARQAAAPKAEAPVAADASGSAASGSIKPAQAGAAPPPKAGAAFRETLWFKKGDVEQLVADAKAKLAASGKPPAEGEVATDDVRPLEDRYVDDGSVTTEDRKKFSLRTGGTATALPAAAGPIPGEHMNESELVQEIGHGRRTAILLVAIAVVVIAAVVVLMSMKGGDKSKVGSEHTAAPSAVALSAPTPIPTPAAAPKAEPTPAPAPAAAAAPSAPAANAAAPAPGTAPAPAPAPAGAEKAAKPAAEEAAKPEAAAAEEAGKKGKAAKAPPAAPHKGKRKH